MTVTLVYGTSISGPVGSLTTVIGSGFIAVHAITIQYDGVTVGSLTSDGAGSFSKDITIPLSIAGKHTVLATDGTTSKTFIFTIVEYCQVTHISDWLGIDINANTKPSRTQVIDWIIRNEERIDRLTGHTWQSMKTYTHDQADVPSGWYDYGRGIPVYLKHRNVQDFDTTKGDKVEIWTGIEWTNQDIDASTFIYADNVRGIMYIRGYLYTILTRNRFRITYRYGGTNEGLTTIVPSDIEKCAVLMTAMDILSRDFKFSQVPYGGEGNIRKEDIMRKWQEEIDNIIWSHSEIQTVM